MLRQLELTVIPEKGNWNRCAQLKLLQSTLTTMKTDKRVSAL